MNLGRYQGDVFPGGIFLDGGVFLHHRPFLYPAVPGFGMAGEVDDDLFMVVFVDRLFFEEGLAVQVVEVVVFLFNEEAFAIQHFIMDILVMMGEAISYPFHIFFCPTDDIIEKAFFHPLFHVDKHHAGIEIPFSMDPLHLQFFFAVRYHSHVVSLEVQIS